MPPTEGREIILKRGSQRKKLVLVARPFPAVGDQINEQGNAVPWVVASVAKTTILADRLIRRKA